MSIEGRSSDSQPGRERLPGELPVACCSLLIRAAHSSGTVGDSHSVPFSSRLRREPFNAANIHNLSVILLYAPQKTVRATAFTPDRMTGKPFPHTGRRTARGWNVQPRRRHCACVPAGSVTPLSAVCPCAPRQRSPHSLPASRTRSRCPYTWCRWRTYTYGHSRRLCSGF